jgi:hypothetical protein
MYDIERLNQAFGPYPMDILPLTREKQRPEQMPAPASISLTVIAAPGCTVGLNYH